jgi:molybdopterin-guanine dinucleotide biosynthesis protein A
VILGLVVAGGRSRRFGADKALEPFAGRSLLDASIAALGAGCARIAVNAPQDGPVAAAARAKGLAVLADPEGAPQGPLAGVLAGLLWARDAEAELLATAPCDTPLLPADLVPRLTDGLAANDGLALARAPDGLHPLCAVWRTRLADPLARRLADGRHPSVRSLLAEFGGREVAFPDARAFFNINSRADLDQLTPLI